MHYESRPLDQELVYSQVTASRAKIGFFGSQSANFERGSPMREMTRVGVDLAKRVIQVHAVDVAWRRISERALTHDRFVLWCAQLLKVCLVAMESSSSTHHWARHLVALGLDAHIMVVHRWTSFPSRPLTNKASCDRASGGAFRQPARRLH